MRSSRVLLTGVSAIGLTIALGLPTSAASPGHHRPLPDRPGADQDQHHPSRVRPHQGSPNSSYPDDLAAHGHFVYFQAFSPGTGDALWRSDGTPGGTLPIYNDIEPADLTWVGDRLFFAADDGTHGRELWVSDGTHGGTHMVVDSVPSGGAYIYDITAIGNRVFYQEDDGVHGYEPWVSNGTPGGTHLVKDIYPGSTASNPYDFTPLGSSAMFAAYDAGHGTELWRSDGTPGGTKLVKDIEPGGLSSSPYWLTSVGSQLVFTADDGSHGTEPWITNGTTKGTHLLRNIGAGSLSGMWNYSSVPAFVHVGNNNTLFFEANDGIHNWELWKTNGTKKGTRLAVDIWTGPRAGDPWTMRFNTQVLLMAAADAAHGYELWRSGGTKATTSFVKDIRPGPKSSSMYLDPGDSARVGTKLVFTADDGSHGSEPWVSNATGSSTKMLRDLLTGIEGSYPDDLVGVQTNAGPRAFFDAYSSVYGGELFVTDGTSAGTKVIDIYP